MITIELYCYNVSVAIKFIDDFAPNKTVMKR